MEKKRYIKRQMSQVMIKVQDLVKQAGGKMYYWWDNQKEGAKDRLALLE